MPEAANVDYPPNVDADQVSRDVQAAADRLQRAAAADERTRDLPIVDLTRRGLA